MDFCMQMAKHVMLEKTKESLEDNIIISPLSINVILNMIAAGMTGETLGQMLTRMKSESVEDINNESCKILEVVNETSKKGPIVTFINGVWVDKHCSLKASYEELLKRIYLCEANQNCDFAKKEAKVREEINSWANSASKGLVKSLLNSPLNPMTKFVHANALYFKGKWMKPFNPGMEQFHLLDGTTIKVPFLVLFNNYNSSDLIYDYGSFDGYTVLKVPYINGPETSFSMCFILPNERNGLPKLLETFNYETISKLKLRKTSLDAIKIPKFKFSYACDVTKTMHDLGLEIPYEKNKLDYGGIIQNPEDLPEPMLETILQKAFIEIDEYGTEAYAVTLRMTGGGSCRPPPPKPKFIADHPFMFAITEDKSGLVFFTGVVLNLKGSRQTKPQSSLFIRKRKYSGSGSGSDSDSSSD